MTELVLNTRQQPLPSPPQSPTRPKIFLKLRLFPESKIPIDINRKIEIFLITIQEEVRRFGIEHKRMASRWDEPGCKRVEKHRNRIYLASRIEYIIREIRQFRSNLPDDQGQSAGRRFLLQQCIRDLERVRATIRVRLGMVGLDVPKVQRMA